MPIQGISHLASPLLASERQQSAIVATIIDRAISAISTVKAFNAAPHEHSRADAASHRLDRAAGKLSAVWGVTSALGQFVMMSMFCAFPNSSFFLMVSLATSTPQSRTLRRSHHRGVLANWHSTTSPLRTHPVLPSPSSSSSPSSSPQMKSHSLSAHPGPANPPSLSSF